MKKWRRIEVDIDDTGVVVDVTFREKPDGEPFSAYEFKSNSIEQRRMLRIVGGIQYLLDRFL